MALLREPGIERLVDVRHFPGSEHVPWTNRATLEARLAAVGIVYEHLVDLGGYRTPRHDSTNRAWRHSGFRGYADHMETRAFTSALDGLLESARSQRVLLMCAEAVPWKCHRQLLADALVARGGHVVHLLGPGKTQDHTMTPFAKVHGGRVTYPASLAKR